MPDGPPRLWQADVESSLRVCENDLDLAQSECLARFGTRALGMASLPDLSPGQISAGQIHTAATLLYAQYLELSGIPTFTEQLAEKAARGELRFHLDHETSMTLGRYHRSAKFRHSPEERRAIYSRLFGGAGSTHPNDAFDDQMRRLATILVEASRHSGSSPVHIRVRAGQAALMLGRELSARAAGATRYDAERILADIRTSHGLLRDPDLARILGGGEPLAIVQRNAGVVLGRQVDPGTVLMRGLAGAEMIRWVADYGVYGDTPSLRGDDPVVVAGVTWHGGVHA